MCSPTRRAIPRGANGGARFPPVRQGKGQEFASKLEGKELEIFRARRLPGEPMTLKGIGEQFGISRERVRQIENRLKKRFKDFLKGRASDIEHQCLS